MNSNYPKNTCHPRQPSQGVPAWILWSSLGLVVFLVVIGLYVFVLRDTWESDHLPQVKSLAEKASNSIAAGNIDEGLRNYQELFALIGDRPLKMKALRDVVEEAQTQYTQIQKQQAMKPMAREVPITQDPVEKDNPNRSSETKDDIPFQVTEKEMPKWYHQKGDVFEPDLLELSFVPTNEINDKTMSITPEFDAKFLSIPVQINGSDAPVVFDHSAIRLVGGRFIAWELSDVDQTVKEKFSVKVKASDGLDTTIEHDIYYLSDRLELDSKGKLLWYFNPDAIGAKVQDRDQGGISWLYYSNKHLFNNPEKIQGNAHVYFRHLQYVQASPPSFIFEVKGSHWRGDDGTGQRLVKDDPTLYRYEAKLMTPDQAARVNRDFQSQSLLVERETVWETKDEFLARIKKNIFQKEQEQFSDGNRYRWYSEKIKGGQGPRSPEALKKITRKITEILADNETICIYHQLAMVEALFLNTSTALYPENPYREAYAHYQAVTYPQAKKLVDQAKSLPLKLTTQIPCSVVAWYEVQPDQFNTVTLQCGNDPPMTLSSKQLTSVQKAVTQLVTFENNVEFRSQKEENRLALDVLLSFASEGHPYQIRLLARTAAKCLKTSRDIKDRIVKTLVEKSLQSSDLAARRIVLQKLLTLDPDPEIYNLIQMGISTADKP
jgi:hypothetical protein